MTAFLRVLLILFSIGIGVGIISNISVFIFKPSYLIMPVWASLTFILIGLIDIIFIILIFKWKKIGLYGYILTWIIYLIISIIISTSIFYLIMNIVFIGILLLAIRPNWKYFK